jgi:hypothetical protein
MGGPHEARHAYAEEGSKMENGSKDERGHAIGFVGTTCLIIVI